MGLLAHVRIFLAPTPLDFPDDYAHPGAVSWAYYQALKASGTPFLVVPSIPGIFAGTSRWASEGLAFRTPLADRFINVVVGQGEDFQRLWTARVANVAVLAGRPARHPALRNYDAVVCPAESYRIWYQKDTGLVPQVVRPEPEAVLRLLRRFRGSLQGEPPPLPPGFAVEERARAEAFAEKAHAESEELGKALAEIGVPR